MAYLPMCEEVVVIKVPLEKRGDRRNCKWEEATQNRGELKTKLQIPAEVLETMSTKELIKVVLDYPCFDDLYFYDNKQEGVEALAQSFNGFQGLLEREDAAGILLNEYKKDIAEQENVSTLMKSKSSAALEKLNHKSNIEVILAQPKIYEKMTQEENEVLDKIIISNQKVARSLVSVGTYKQNTFLELLDEQQNPNKQELTKSTRAATVRTPNGSLVFVETFDDYLSANNKYFMKLEVQQSFPGTTFVAQATSKYNCHSYAWYSQDYNGNRYRVWFSGTHTALVNKAGQTNNMISKWGSFHLCSIVCQIILIIMHL